MELLILKLVPRYPISTEIAIDPKLRAFILDMALDAFQSFNLFETGETLNFKSLALIFNVLLKVFEVNLLFELALLALVHYLDLS